MSYAKRVGLRSYKTHRSWTKIVQVNYLQGHSKLYVTPLGRFTLTASIYWRSAANWHVIRPPFLSEVVFQLKGHVPHLQSKPSVYAVEIVDTGGLKTLTLLTSMERIFQECEARKGPEILTIHQEHRYLLFPYEHELWYLLSGMNQI